MKKEELEKNAEKKADEWIKKSIENISLSYWLSYKLGYIDGATEETRDLEKENTELTDNLREVTRELEEERFVTEDLKKQIEKMKCCANCEYTPPFDKHCDNCIRGSIKFRYMNWQLRR